MTVSTISILTNGAESSSKLNKLLNSNSNIDNPDNGISFNATMDDVALNTQLDELLMLADGTVVAPEQLFEMLENGNTLPGLNLAAMQKLQNHMTQAGFDNSTPQQSDSIKFGMQPEIKANIDSGLSTSNSLNNAMNNKFSLTQNQLVNQQFAQGQSLKTNVVVPELFLMSANNINSTLLVTPELSTNVFSATYGFQFISGPEGASNLISNTFNIATPVQHPQWNQSLGQSVQWMVNQNIQQAEIKLNPPELGMLDIRITVTNDQATVHFTAPNTAVREALELSMPKLREMLEESGVSLADVNVSEHSHEQSETNDNSDKSTASQTSSSEESVNSKTGVDNISNRMPIGLLDTYA